MNSWQTEYERRLRRVAGVTDDSLTVRVETENEKTWYGGCDTCGGYTISTWVKIYVGNTWTESWSASGEGAFGDLIRALAEVEDD